MLVALDFEGTVVESDPYVRLGERYGTGGEIAAILEQVWTDERPASAGIRAAVDHLDGMPFPEAENVFESLQVRPGASSLLSALHAADHDVAIVSDAPELAVRYCLDPVELDVDTVVANDLPAENGAFTGEIQGPVLGRSKADVLEELAVERGRPLDETVAIGNDQRDLPMLQAAGLGVAVDATPTVEAQSDLAVSSLERLELTLEERGLI